MGVVRTIRQWWLTGLCAGLACYFAGHGLTGEESVTAWAQATRAAQIARTDAQVATQARDALALRAARLREESLDLDYLEERARALAGVAHPRDVLAIGFAPSR